MAEILHKLKSYFTGKEARPSGSVARFLHEAPSREQKKIFMKSIDGSIARQQKVIKEAEIVSE